VCPICRKVLIENDNNSNQINEIAIDVDSIINIVYNQELSSGILDYLNRIVPNITDKSLFLQRMRDMSFSIGVAVSELQSREVIYGQYDDDDNDSIDSF